jgi:ribosomal protein S18 acetylase RimI-like enzyme
VTVHALIAYGLAEFTNLDLFEVPPARDDSGMQTREDEDEGRALLARAAVLSLAVVAADGTPALRTVQPLLGHGHGRDDGQLLVRLVGGGSFAGLEGRVVVGAHELVVSIDDTTYGITAQAEGTLEPVPGDGASCVARVSIERVTSVAALGQHHAIDERQRVLHRLWRRGRPGDVSAVALLLARFPELGTPTFLRPRADLDERGLRLQCGLADHELDDVLDLLCGLYWLSDVPRGDIRAAVLSSTAIVAARDPGSNRIAAFARAVSDGKCAWIYDVVVADHLRGSHVGSAIMEVLLDHPSVRHVRHVRLTTRDAMPFYRRLGFRDLAEAPRYAWTSTEMIRAGSASLRSSERGGEAEAGRTVAEERIDPGLRQLAGRS